MTDGEASFSATLKAAVGSPGAPFVFAGNFEVEDEWARDEPGLPRIGFRSNARVVNRMDEFALLLAGREDYVLLKAQPDPAYADYLGDLGLELPTVLAVQDSDPDRTVSRDAVADPLVRKELGELARTQGARLLPHGVSEVEESLAELAGIPLATPSAAVCKAVNGKVYSRRLGERIGLRQPFGRACETVPEFAAAAVEARRVLAGGGRVVVKDSYGVSGKGLLVLDDPERLDQLRLKIERRAQRTGSDRVTLVVEEWIGKRTDLNYQFVVSTDGSVRFTFVKEALTENGVHKGHRFPAELPADQIGEIEAAAGEIGRHLAADGYYGVVGVDAMIGTDGLVYPIVEINARNNMSTYQCRLQERLIGPDRTALATHYPVRPSSPVGFPAIRAGLAAWEFSPATGSGLIISNFATVNAAATSAGTAYDGRLYAVLVAEDDRRLAELDTNVSAALTTIVEGNRA